MNYSPIYSYYYNDDKGNKISVDIRRYDIDWIDRWTPDIYCSRYINSTTELVFKVVNVKENIEIKLPAEIKGTRSGIIELSYILNFIIESAYSYEKKNKYYRAQDLISRINRINNRHICEYYELIKTKSTWYLETYRLIQLLEVVLYHRCNPRKINLNDILGIVYI